MSITVKEVANLITEKVQQEHVLYPSLPLVLSTPIRIGFARVIQAKLREKKNGYFFDIEVSRVDQDGFVESGETIRADINGQIQWGRLTEAVRDTAAVWMR